MNGTMAAETAQITTMAAPANKCGPGNNFSARNLGVAQEHVAAVAPCPNHGAMKEDVACSMNVMCKSNKGNVTVNVTRQLRQRILYPNHPSSQVLKTP